MNKALELSQKAILDCLKKTTDSYLEDSLSISELKNILTDRIEKEYKYIASIPKK